MTVYLLWACLILITLVLAGIAVVARRLHRIELARIKESRSRQRNSATTISLLEKVVVALKELGTRQIAGEQERSSIASSLQQIGAAQGRDDRLVDEIKNHLLALDGTLGSTIEEFDRFRRIAARRDERLIAIDASMAAIEERLVNLSKHMDRSPQEHPALAKSAPSLGKPVHTLTKEPARLSRLKSDSKAVDPNAYSPRIGNDRVAKRDIDPAAAAYMHRNMKAN
jgi:chromosome segregation ATPase